MAAGLQYGELGTGVDLKVRVGVLHGIKMTGLTGQVKQKVLPLDQILHGMFIPHIRDVDLKGIPERLDIPEIAAVLRYQAVHQGYVSPLADKSLGKIGTDKADPSGYHHPLASEN